MTVISEQFLSGRYSFLPIDTVLFGLHSIDKLSDEMDRLGIKAPLIITGNTISTKTQLINKVLNKLPNQNCKIFSKVSERAPLAAVLEATKISIEMKADCILGIGGSTISDASRVITVLNAYDIDSETQFKKWFKEKMPLELLDTHGKSILKQIFVPTTLSAGELNYASGTFDPAEKRKLRFGHPRLAPTLIVYDPQFSTDTPPWLWLSSGIKALDHAIERLYSPDCNPITETSCIRAIELLTEFLPKTIDADHTLQDRAQCFLGAWLSMSGYPNGGLGLSHAIGHVLGVKHWIPHGYTSCITQPGVMEFNLPYSIHQQASIAMAMGCKKQNKSHEAIATEGHARLRHFVRELQLPQRLSKVGIKSADLKSIACDTLHDAGTQHNIRPVTNSDQVIQVLRNMF